MRTLKFASIIQSLNGISSAQFLISSNNKAVVEGQSIKWTPCICSYYLKQLHYSLDTLLKIRSENYQMKKKFKCLIF